VFGRSPRFAKHYPQLKALRQRVRRNLQRQWKRYLAGVVLLLALGQAPVIAASSVPRIEAGDKGQTLAR